MNKKYIINLYRSILVTLNLQPIQVIVTMSAAMVLHGLRDTADDLNLIVIPSVFNMLAKTNAYPIYYSGETPILLYLPGVTMGAKTSSACPIKIIDGVYCDTLANILYYKKLLNRPKDLNDINILIKAIAEESNISIDQNPPPDIKEDKPLVRLNVGCGRNIIPGWINIDSASIDGVNMIAELDSLDGSRICLDLSNDTVDEFLLSHVLEHIRYPLPLMKELHRIAKPDAVMTVRVPYGSSDDAFEDPTHVRQYFIGSWGYFSQPFYWRADYGYRGDWEVQEINLYINKSGREHLTDNEIATLIKYQRNIVVEMVVILKPIKPIRKPLKELQTSPQINILWA